MTIRQRAFVVGFRLGRGRALVAGYQAQHQYQHYQCQYQYQYQKQQQRLFVSNDGNTREPPLWLKNACAHSIEISREMSRDEVVQRSKDLLNSTNLPNIQKPPSLQHTTESQRVHRGFLQLTLLTIRHRLPNLGLSLSDRAYRLGYEYPLPIWQSLAESLARDSPHPEPDLFRISLCVTPASPTFYAETLKILIQRGHFASTSALLQALLERYEGHHLDDMCVELSSVLKHNIQQQFDYFSKQTQHTFQDANAGQQWNEAAATDLVLLLHKMLDPKEHESQVKPDMSSEQRLQSILDSMLKRTAAPKPHNLDDDDESDDDDDDDDDDESDDDDDDNLIHDKFSTAHEVPKYAEFVLSESEESGMTVSVQVDPFMGMPNDEEQHDELAADWIYLRDSKRWKLPDITEQMVELNGGKDVLYTKEYERQILLAFRKAEEEENYDDYEPI